MLWSIANYQFPLHASWGRILVLFAVMVVVPVTLNLLANSFAERSIYFLKKLEIWTLPSGVLLVIAYSIEQGIVAGLLTVPWLLITLAVAGIGCTMLVDLRFRFSIKKMSIAAGMVYFSVGGVWALIDRMGWQPMGYDPEIIFLTVAHFHYAGFVLPIVAGFVFGEMKNVWAKIMVIGILSGVLLVAAGIVNSHLGNAPALESFAAWWLALSAMLLAFLQIKLALKKGVAAKVALCWSLAGVALIGGMVLAGLYGIRHVYPIEGLDIPIMRFLHGSANAVGFGFFAVVGWWFNETASLSRMKPPSAVRGQTGVI